MSLIFPLTHREDSNARTVLVAFNDVDTKRSLSQVLARLGITNVKWVKHDSKIKRSIQKRCVAMQNGYKAIFLDDTQDVKKIYEDIMQIYTVRQITNFPKICMLVDPDREKNLEINFYNL